MVLSDATDIDLSFMELKRSRGCKVTDGINSRNFSRKPAGQVGFQVASNLVDLVKEHLLDRSWMA